MVGCPKDGNMPHYTGQYKIHVRNSAIEEEIKKEIELESKCAYIPFRRTPKALVWVDEQKLERESDKKYKQNN